MFLNARSLLPYHSGSAYRGQCALTDTVPETGSTEYWLAPWDTTTSQKFRIRLSCASTISSVKIRNSFNGCCTTQVYVNVSISIWTLHDNLTLFYLMTRGTKDFVIRLKAPGSTQWNAFVSGTLPDPNPHRSTDRTPPLQTYRAGLKNGPQVARIFQASWGRSGKQQQKQNSPNLGTTF